MRRRGSDLLERHCPPAQEMDRNIELTLIARWEDWREILCMGMKSTRWGMFLLLAADAGCASQMASNAPTVSKRPSLAAYLAALPHVRDAAGLSFAAYSQGRIIETGAFGVANKESTERMTAHTPTRLASMTKPVAAGLLIAAAQQGLVDLEQPVWAVAPKFAARCPEIKAKFARRGLPFMHDVECGDPNLTVRSVLSHTVSSTTGTSFKYNGFLYGRLAEAIAQAYRAPSMEAVVRDQVIEPLGLKETIAGVADPRGGRVIIQMARPHSSSAAGPLARQFLDDRLNAGAGLIASATDAARLFSALAAGQLFGPDVVHEMIAPTPLSDGATSPYGLGVFTGTYRGRRVIWHTGWQPNGYTGIWMHDLEAGDGIVILSNTDLNSIAGEFSASSLEASQLAEAFFRWQQK